MAGKIFTKEEADKLFGPVIKSVNIDIIIFNSLLDKTIERIMFAILNGELYILGDTRDVLYPVKRTVPKEDVFAWASKSVVLELLKNTTADSLALGDLAVEIREDHTTVTYGNYTLQEMMLCPPLCE
jgi:hypothetical protein